MPIADINFILPAPDFQQFASAFQYQLPEDRVRGTSSVHPIHSGLYDFMK